MAVNVLFGESVATLAKTCFDRVGKSIAANIDKNIILIVPETSKLDIEQSLINMTDSSGLMNIEVLSFSRLCHKVLGEAGLASVKYVGEMGKAMLVYKALKDTEDNLLVYRNLCTNPKFVSSVISVMGEMKRSLISPEILLEKSSLISDPVAATKARELAEIMAAYELELLKYGLKDSQEQYSAAALVLENTVRDFREGILKWPYDRLLRVLYSEIWILGFGEIRDFTPQEYAILDIFANFTEVNITLVCDQKIGNGENSSEQVGNDIFKAGRQCFDSIRQKWRLGLEEYISPDRPLIFDHLRMCLVSDNPYTLNVQESLNSTRGSNGEVCLISASDVTEELSVIAGEINRLVSANQIRFRDINVLITDVAKYKKHVRTIFIDANIPFYIDEKKILSDTAPGRAVTALLNIIDSGWHNNHIMAYLKSGLCNADRSEIDNFETFILSRGIRYRKGIFDDSRYIDSKTRLPKYIELRDRLFINIREFDRSVKTCSTTGEFCNAFTEFLKAERIEEKIKIFSEGLIEQNLIDAATTTVKAWNLLTDLVAQMSVIATDTKISFGEFRGIIISGMEKAISGTIPYSVDCVQISGIRQLTGRNPKAIFVAGLNSEAFPGRITDEGLLNDKDREIFSEYLDIRIPSILNDKLFEDRYLAYTFMTISQDKLFLSCSRTEAGESKIITLVRQSVEGVRESNFTDNPSPDSVQVYDINTALSVLSRFLNGDCRVSGKYVEISEEISGKWKAFETILSQKASTRDRMADIRSVARKATPEIVLSPDLILKRFRGNPQMSISQLEKFASCAFLHYSEYLLKLRDRDRREIKYLETGSILHGILELAVHKFIDEISMVNGNDSKQEIINRYSNYDYDAISAECLRMIAERDRLEIFLDRGNFSAKGIPAIKLASGMLKNIFNNLYTDSLIPEKTEWKFSDDDGTALQIDTGNNTRISLTGKIDRIDSSDTEFRIIDYKSGTKKISFDEWYHGLSLQLPAYLAVYMRAEPGKSPADAGYSLFERPLYDLSDIASDMTDDAVKDKIAKANKTFGTRMSSEQLAASAKHTLTKIGYLSSQLTRGKYGVVPKRIYGEKLPCDNCKFQSVCGFEKEYDRSESLAKLPKSISGQGKKVKAQDEFIRAISGGDN